MNNKRYACLLSLFTVVVLSILQNPAQAAFDTSLADNYLQTQFDYAMSIQAQAMPHYLNYPGSRLQDLTRVQIFSREFLQPNRIAAPAKLYQELWYSNTNSIGLRQKSKLNISSDKIGAIVVGKINSNAYEPQAVGNALIRLLLDLHFKHLIVSVVMLPADNFDQIAHYLINYNFYRVDEAPDDGEHFSVCLRSYPGGKEEYYYYSP